MYAATLPLAFMAQGWAAALADPVTYEGTIGRLSVVVELTDDPASTDGPVAGRYFYRSQGIDIPLQFVRRDGSALVLREEAACPSDGCTGDPLPAGGTWTLSDGTEPGTMQGRWSDTAELAVHLRRIRQGTQSRGDAETPRDLFESSAHLAYSETAIEAATHPYDFLRLDFPVTALATAGWEGATYAMVADGRTGVRHLRIVDLPGGGPADPANRLLEQRRWKMNLGAFGCMALRYRGFHDDTGFWSSDFGTAAGYEHVTVRVSQLTDRLMAWTESGSLWCGGASPSNFQTSDVMDIRAGRLVDMSDIFAGWTRSGPDEALAAFVDTRRGPDSDADLAEEERCGFADLVRTNLAARPVRGDDGEMLVTFGIYGLPTVVNACSGDLVTVPVGDIARFLTAYGADLLR